LTNINNNRLTFSYFSKLSFI